MRVAVAVLRRALGAGQPIDIRVVLGVGREGGFPIVLVEYSV